MAVMNMPLLYRHILKAASRFPSIKRDAIIQDIKLEFRANKASSVASFKGEDRQWCDFLQLRGSIDECPKSIVVLGMSLLQST